MLTCQMLTLFSYVRDARKSLTSQNASPHTLFHPTSKMSKIDAWFKLMTLLWNIISFVGYLVQTRKQIVKTKTGEIWNTNISNWLLSWQGSGQCDTFQVNKRKISIEIILMLCHRNCLALCRCTKYTYFIFQSCAKQHSHPAHNTQWMIYIPYSLKHPNCIVWNTEHTNTMTARNAISIWCVLFACHRKWRPGLWYHVQS